MHNQELSSSLKIQGFLDYLRGRGNIADWQMRQTGNAVQVYANQFLDKNWGE
jgi:hypothetical protein